ncbi:DUF871 domain-containing protein [Heyndrickxia sporothermodurans]|uniref:Uncharacterized protein n=1 Tax=Heyndrickxia sporothermodurans TaxID=46224 RepID=A0A150KK53_9BACI|nr:DUF871 domain-containing protein [Heyndrickxia sporothermodurans]KYC84161.1 hypothetical protein B4102_4237 [Heyndrickxia sporothermodurans]MEB6550112.1 DUF871 domain-containing protein [Heyndrickxia sporothermodurans]MED3652895.1 DUF871 domain-containing protein [Heyndrickxia sporothermodurans]MED3779693.1 DUF871 domain-containing protein [Heyndrickxia sporothermodurans]PTY77447.1 outer surface protein [Heyndrickxia sporothermodurans]
MRQLGISVYPQYGTVKEQIDYLEKASSYGFTRMFTCLMSASEEKDLHTLKVLLAKANELGFEIIADVSPSVFQDLNLSFRDLGYFKELGLSGLRLDLGFSGLEESIMSLNEYGLKIELNMSQGTNYLEQILSYSPNKHTLIGCHNFYPRKYTGLSREHFIKCSKQYKEHGIRTAAMISSSHAKYGPWPVQEGLPTLEEHRYLPITVQAKDLYNTGLIDDLIIGNSFASDEELKQLSELNRYLLELSVDFVPNVSELEKKIALEKIHVNRGDVSAYVIRSTESRVQYKQESIPAHDTQSIKRGSVTIDNDHYERYKGELHIALQEMENEGKTNTIGYIVKEETFLLNKIRPWQKFRLVERTER